jgi:hypothetical protein
MGPRQVAAFTGGNLSTALFLKGLEVDQRGFCLADATSMGYRANGWDPKGRGVQG